MEKSIKGEFDFNLMLSKETREALDLKIVEALFNILYKNNLISSKEHTTLIAHLNRKLKEFSN